MKFNPFKHISHVVMYNFFLAVGNLIPLIGYFFFNWTFKHIFLFYAVELFAYELTILPRIGLYVFAAKEYGDNMPTVKKLGILMSWILYSLVFFFFNMMLLVLAGLSEDNSFAGLTSFIYLNAFFIIYIFADYIYWFVKDYLLDRDHKVIDPDSEIAEIAGLPLLVLVPNILVIVIMPALSFHDEKILFVMMLIVIIIKTGSQYAKRYRKDIKGKNAVKPKDHLKTDRSNSISDLISDSTGYFDMKVIERTAIDVRHLPVEKERSDPLIVIISIFALAIASAVWFAIAVHVSGFTGSLPSSLFPLILSAAFCFFGIYRLVGKVFIRITEDKVFYRERRFRGYTQWEKDLPADFRGVLVDTIINKTDDGEETKYYIKLFARDKKAVVLFESRFKSETYNVLNQFAPALGLPALEEIDGEIVERKP